MVSAIMLGLPREKFDPSFRGQDLETTYFDTRRFRLRRERAKSDQYLTLRIRSYGSDTYALSAKTESEKFRVEIDPFDAQAALTGQYTSLWQSQLPASLLARLNTLVDPTEITPVVKVCCTRYATEDKINRFTLDIVPRTDTGKRLGTNVLELKSSQASPDIIAELTPLRPIKLSKFLWSTDRR